MKRKIQEKLIQWKNKKGRMPLILNGARQVGKTYILKDFAASHFNQFVYINLETNSHINSYFDGDINPMHIVRKHSVNPVLYS